MCFKFVQHVVAPIAAVVAAPFTGGASLAVYAGVQALTGKRPDPLAQIGGLAAGVATGASALGFSNPFTALGGMASGLLGQATATPGVGASSSTAVPGTPGDGSAAPGAPAAPPVGNPATDKPGFWVNLGNTAANAAVGQTVSALFRPELSKATGVPITGPAASAFSSDQLDAVNRIRQDVGLPTVTANDAGIFAGNSPAAASSSPASSLGASSSVLLIGGLALVALVLLRKR